MIDFSKVHEQMKRQGFKFAEPVQINVHESKKAMQQAFEYFLPGYKWTAEYDQVAEWLTDNKGKGLLLYGANGRGKTVLTKVILPSIFLAAFNFVLKAYDAYQMNIELDEILKKRMIALDDVGTEDVKMNFGEKRWAFPEIMDMAEKRGNLVIVSTNSDAKQLKERYGIRTVERLISTCNRVTFTGESFRQ